MSRSAEPSRPAGPVELLEVTDHVLDRLLAVALDDADADADDVTPPLGGASWNPERITWFFEYHRAAAVVLEAQTTIGNTPARALLRSVGAALEPGAPTGGGPATVAARIRLR